MTYWDREILKDVEVVLAYGALTLKFDKVKDLIEI